MPLVRSSARFFDAFELRILHDKVQRRIEFSAALSEAVAGTLRNASDLPKEVAHITQTT